MFTLLFVHHIFLAIIESHLCYGSEVLVRVKNIFIAFFLNVRNMFILICFKRIES